MTKELFRFFAIRPGRRTLAALIAGSVVAAGALQAANLTWVGPLDGSGDISDPANWNTTGLDPVDEPAGEGDFLFFGYRGDTELYPLILEVPEENPIELGFGGWRIGFRGVFDLEITGGGTVSGFQTHIGRLDAGTDSHGTLTLTGPGTTWINGGDQPSLIGISGGGAGPDTEASGIININDGATYSHTSSEPFYLGYDSEEEGVYSGTVNVNGTGNTFSVTNEASDFFVGWSEVGSATGEVNLNGGTIDLNTTATVAQGATSAGTLHLGNGADESVFRAPAVAGGGGASTVRFDNVTFESVRNGTDLLSGVDTVEVGAGGLNIDLRGFGVSMSQEDISGGGVLRVSDSSELPGFLGFDGSYPGGEVVVEEGASFRPGDRSSGALAQLTVNAGATMGPIGGGTTEEAAVFADNFDAEPAGGWDPDGGEFDDPEQTWEYGEPVSVPASPDGGNVYAAKLDGFTADEWTESWLHSPVVDLRGLGSASLSFEEFLSLDPDGGAGNPDHPEGFWHWAEVNVIDAGTGETLEQLALRYAVDTEWADRTYALSPESLDREVIFEFLLVVDDFGPAEGWFLDDVRVTTSVPAHAIGTYSTGAATLRGGWEVQYDGGGIDRLDVGGELDLTGSTVNFQSGESGIDGEALVFGTYDSLEGTFAGVENVPEGYVLDYEYEGNSLALVLDGDPPPPGSAYEEWATGFGLDPDTDGAPGADANGDGVANLARFAMGHSPLEFTELPSPKISGGNLEIEYTRLVEGADEVEIVAEAAAEPGGSWSTEGVQDTLVETVDGIEHRVARIPVDGERGFLRLVFNAL